MRRTAAVLTVLAAIAAALPARAGDTVATPNATVRLLDGGAMGETRLSGVEIALAPHWKTYWRVPGDTGVPPEFDWTASANVKAVNVGWPAPARLRDATGGDVIGYETAVVFPVEVTPLDAAAPVDLRLTLHFAVCHDICLPAVAAVDRRLDPASPGADRASIIAARTAVPSEAEADAVTVGAVTLETTGEPALLIDLAGPAVTAETDILVEGPATAYFGPPQSAGISAAGHRFRLPVSVTGDPAALAGKAVTLTILAGETRLVRKASIR
jgi:DsbC/DsbD-like thiol-disulfide interchange protein